MIREIGIQTARELLDYSGGHDRENEMWSTQLEGAVAIHNVLVREKVAYLADEVGMGKTYVALGVVALFRHFHPGWKVLYIAPNENIQVKWRKELLNFTANNWKLADNRVKTFQGLPAWPVVLPHNLAHLAHEVLIDSDRDFIVRMSSFSLGVADDRHAWQERRKHLLASLPWLDKHLLEAEDKEEFKDNYGRVINQILGRTHFDLVVVDEAHNLKHGLHLGVATRNRLISYVLGHPEGASPDLFPNYGIRFSRLLLLSATPLESDYKEIVNQLRVFNMDAGWRSLADPEKSDEEKRSQVGQILVRRLTELRTGGGRYTKNMYRREWRNGGVDIHDQPLAIADDRQRLIVALVQKKVAEVLGSARFNNSFQVGMLSSFESFLETARVKRKEDESIFDQADQTDSDEEKDGIDTPSVNKLARQYARRFGEPMPHPKMDTVARHLANSFATGEKTLVFVRRIRSVDEIAEKLSLEYDRLLKQKILQGLPPTTHGAFEDIFERYLQERNARVRSTIVDTGTDGSGEERPELPVLEVVKDDGGKDSFFAWFFRGKGPKGVFSGAGLVQNRLTSEASAYSTFFEDNLVGWLVGGTNNLIQRLAELCGKSEHEIKNLLIQTAFGIYRERPERKKAAYLRFHVFHAYQEAGLKILAEYGADKKLRDRATIVLRQMYGLKQRVRRAAPDRFPKPEDMLGGTTFFTALSGHAELKEDIWPERTNGDLQEIFRERQIRRELLSAVIRLGNPLIDLWLLVVQQVGSLAARAEAESDTRVADLVHAFIDLLDTQRRDPARTFSSYREIAEVSRNFDLILNTNFPEARTLPLLQLARYFGRALAKQTPVGGMFGEVNKSMARQFLMPGYPLILVTTDVLREGADLHTFCAEVMHYGIAWTPSSMEQRTGRVDRINSYTHRRLSANQALSSDAMLQVYYPHLRDTVEKVQVERVYERMNQFVRALHQTLSPGKAGESTIKFAQEVINRPRDIEVITGRLSTPFDVKREWLREDLPVNLGTTTRQIELVISHFERMMSDVLKEISVDTEPGHDRWEQYLTIYLDHSGVAAKPASSRDGLRRQPVAVFLHAHGRGGQIFLRCVSPIGVIPTTDFAKIMELRYLNLRGERAKICSIFDPRSDTYNVTVEADIFFHPNTTQALEVQDLVLTTARQADRLEYELLPDRDRTMEEFRTNLVQEPRRE